ncbi:MAG TPA: VWA domain-containing protein [Solirubrobacterales bacterium]
MSERAPSPPAEPEPGVVEERLAEFARILRARGARVGTGDLIRAQRALATVDPGDPRRARFALKATLCASPADRAAFDEAFAAWMGEAPLELEEPFDPEAIAPPRVLGVKGERPPLLTAGEEDLRPAAWSDLEILAQKDFAEYTDAERALAQRLMREIASRGPLRLSRRTRATRRRTRMPDPRATLRASLRHAGEPFERRWRTLRHRRRPLILVVDVSGSMAPYSRMLLQYAQAAVAAHARCEAFAFGTRLTRLTADLRGRDPDAALRRAAAALTDWSGGTRIGAALGTLNREHGGRIGRGAVVAILSDGWDRGDPEELRDEVARLQRCAHALIWLNPLKASPGYEPLTRGMRAALPYVDAFLAANNLASLAELAALLEGGLDGAR